MTKSVMSVYERIKRLADEVDERETLASWQVSEVHRLCAELEAVLSGCRRRVGR